MRYVTAVLDGMPRPALVVGERLLSFARLARDTVTALPTSLLDAVVHGDAAVRAALPEWTASHDLSDLPDIGTARLTLPFRPPGKIWGIGLNYRAHAEDLDEAVPPEPASFMKPASCVVGPGQAIGLPAVSQRVTAEAELGVVFGREARDVGLDEALAAVFAFTTVLDLTAEDILRVNPRFLTRAKSFDGFFSFGPVLVTPDEIADPASLRVRIVHNGHEGPSDVVRNMTYAPAELIAFHSRGMTWEPGDILSTGTPGAVPIRSGDSLSCIIDGIGRLDNAVA
ncbi:MAG: fumarylacetoacetate hydrolase family protein [Deinococcales bacterium]